MKKLKLLSKGMIPLLPGNIYSLEDISKLSKFILIKMLELLGESAWGVINVTDAIRSFTQKNYHIFHLKYSRLTAEQKQILELLAQKPGQAVLAEKIVQKIKSPKQINLEKEINALISTFWIIGGAHDNKLVILITAEIAQLIDILPLYLAYLGAEKPSDTPVDESRPKLFDDLCQLTSHILIEPPKVTNAELLGKASLKKIMPNLSPQANNRWEDYLREGYYPLGFNILLDICGFIGCVEVIPTPSGGRIQILKAEKYIEYLEIPPPRRLGVALLIFFEQLKFLNNNEFYEAAGNLLLFGQEAKGKFLSPLKLAQLCSKNAKYQPSQYGEIHDRYFTDYVFEPLFYLGFVERISIDMPVPWRSSPKDFIAQRHLWRLSPLGLLFGDILRQVEKNHFKTQNRPGNKIYRPDVGTLVQLALKSGDNCLLNDNLILDSFKKVIPPVVQKELVVQNDMTFFLPLNAPPGLIWLLYVFGEVNNGAGNNYIVSGKFTKESVIKALKSGLTIDWLISLMKLESKTELSNTVLRLLLDWSSNYNRAIFAKVTVLVCDTPELAAELAANTKFSKVILGRLGSQTVFIRDDAEKTVRQWLEKKGRVPLPGVYSGEPLAKWVDEHTI